MDFTDQRYLTADEMDIPEEDLSKPLDFALGFHAPGCLAKAIDAQKNADQQGVKNCTFQQLDLMHFWTIRSDLEAFGLPDLVITDPPPDSSGLRQGNSASRREAKVVCIK